MKTLILLRHAKSSWDDASLEDIDRPLNDRGKKACDRMGKYILKQKLAPDGIVSSPAKRARQTVDLVVKASGLTIAPAFDKRIYEATARGLLEVVRQFDDAANTQMMIGHNPGFEEFLKSLTGETQVMPTAALASIELDVEKWKKVEPGVGKLKWIVRPKELKRAE